MWSWLDKFWESGIDFADWLELVLFKKYITPVVVILVTLPLIFVLIILSFINNICNWIIGE